MTNLRNALAYLDAHTNLEATAGQVHGLSLQRMRALCDVLGDPQHAFPSITITGTNGKGSVARMITALLRAADLGVGTYTSPHLESITERMMYDGEPIPPDVMAALIEDLSTLEPLLVERPSYFELLTAAALSWFADIPVDVAVLEVGLLGRFDATNVADASVAVLTNVGKDHTDGVGDWRRRIAEEKVGIVKPGATFVLGETDPQLADIFAQAPTAELWLADRDFSVVQDDIAFGGRLLTLETPSHQVDEIFVPLAGAHQARNASLALAATEALIHKPLDADLIRAAFASVSVPGRFEIVHREPTVILDGAHNPDGMAAAAATLASDFTLGGTLIIVAGMLSERDPVEMLRALDATQAGYFVACTPPSPRAIPAAQLAGIADTLGIVAEAVPSVNDAVRRALALATADDVILVTGSLYVVGAARRALLHPELGGELADDFDPDQWVERWDESERAARRAAYLRPSSTLDASRGVLTDDPRNDGEEGMWA